MRDLPKILEPKGGAPGATVVGRLVGPPGMGPGGSPGGGRGRWCWWVGRGVGRGVEVSQELLHLLLYGLVSQVHLLHLLLRSSVICSQLLDLRCQGHYCSRV